MDGRGRREVECGKCRRRGTQIASAVAGALAIRCRHVEVPLLRTLRLAHSQRSAPRPRSPRTSTVLRTDGYPRWLAVNLAQSVSLGRSLPVSTSRRRRPYLRGVRSNYGPATEGLSLAAKSLTASLKSTLQSNNSK